MRDDLKVIGDLCDALGGLSAAARELSTDEQQLTPQHIYNWRKRGRVAPEQRLHFLTVFNRVMPKRKHLDLSEEQFACIVRKSGNSISAITKEATTSKRTAVTPA